MPSPRRQKRPARPSSKAAVHGKPAPPKKSAPAKGVPAPKSAPAARTGGSHRSNAAAAAPNPPLELPLPDGRRHVLSLSFVRDGDEFMARLETDSGHITELKNRSLDQLLTLVASELEDLLE